MNRREAIEKVTFLLGGAMTGSHAFLSSSFTFRGTRLLSEEQKALLNEIGETILPATDTPGAKEADVAAFMDVIVTDCYTPAEQRIFMEGISKLEEACRKAYGKKFGAISPALREKLLTDIDKEHIAYMAGKKSGDPVHYFRMFKELTLAGYFTSEAGATKFLKYNPAPGRYDGCTSEKPWY
ncbi:MAG: hypothetical protein ABS46_02035 [Cytophagaceae bacterium SCN 52-12]|nr:MAG: hypothetical protein ABS46_02035 [Cytophagaceae bacterium SCN 52-12]